MKFKEFKAIIIEKAKETNACEEEFKRAVESKSYKELFDRALTIGTYCFRAPESYPLIAPCNRPFVKNFEKKR